MTSSWHYRKAGAPAGQESGPLSWDQLSTLAQSGELAPDDLVRGPGYEDPLKAGRVPGLYQTSAQPGARGPYPGMGPSAVSGPASLAGWHGWIGALIALVIIGAGAGVYFGVLWDRDGSAQSASAGVATVASDTGPTTSSASTSTSTAQVITPTSAVWADAAPAGTVPSARRGHCMAYDPATGKVILFGGYDGASVFGDTWAYDPVTNTWTGLEPVGSLPPARQAGTMIYDETAGKMMLFGGWDLSRGLNDTWEYDPVTNTWAEIVPAGGSPPARWGHAMAYDLGTKSTVVSGGYNGTVCLDDTWLYDRVTNTWAGGTDPGSPPARRSHAMAYDPAGAGWTITFAGWDGEALYDSTWSYDSYGVSWADLDPSGDTPPAHTSYALAYDPVAGDIIMFGGWDGESALAETWVFDSTDISWSKVDTPGATPSARYSHAMAYADQTDAMIVFGGWDGAACLDDTWVLTPSR